MSDIAVKVQNLSKQYKIGEHQQAYYRTLRESVMGTISAPWRHLKNVSHSIRSPQRTTDEKERTTHHRHALSSPDDTIWALKDVSFEVKQGEVVGIIGPNGAGKTTLLKVLSRITEPTKGRAEIHGRVGSLLEVGTGFHPELTGRENIYLNGAILGMKRAEIQKRFDEIVAFTEIEKFIDTPVKRYSSGMYVRLAFAVAAHLEPDILLVDEVLAVGDASFQKKCLGRMNDIAEKGRTVLFVSHNMGAILALCTRSLLLKAGCLMTEGDTSKVVQYYQAESLTLICDRSDLRNAERRGTGKANFYSISIKAFARTGGELAVAVTGCDLVIEVAVYCVARIDEANVAVIINDANGYRIIDVNTAQKGMFVSMKGRQRAVVKFTMQDVLLKPGTYVVGLWLGRGGIEHIDKIDYATSFTVVENPDSTQHVEVFPGPYLCRFESTVLYEKEIIL